MSDFRYGDNYMVGNTYHAQDGTRFDNRAARDAYDQGRLGQGRFQGQGDGGGAPRGAGSGGGGGGLGGAYANALNSANAANESRYADILGGYDAMTGGGGAKPKKRGGLPVMFGAMNNPVEAWKRSGSQMGYSEWSQLQKMLEQMAAKRGGAYGSIDASRVYPRMYGEGEFLGTPPTGQQPIGGQYGQRPTMPPPVYPTYTPPSRGNQNY